jgi:hypothetical protein
MSVIAPKSSSLLIFLAIGAALWLISGCESRADSQRQVPTTSVAAASDSCVLNTTQLRTLRDDIIRAVGASGTHVDTLAESQETLQSWTDQCTARASEFDRIAAGSLWNRVGASWEIRANYEQSAFAFMRAASLLRETSNAEEYLVAIRGRATSEWSRGNHSMGLSLAREQLGVARTFHNESPATASLLADSLQFASEFAGRAGLEIESVSLNSEAKALRSAMEGKPPTNDVPVPKPK